MCLYILFFIGHPDNYRDCSLLIIFLGVLNFICSFQNILIYLIAHYIISINMSNSSKIKEHKNKLLKQYKQLIEDAYNFRQTDSALSDISEYRALKLLDQLNRLNFLSREPLQSVS